MENINQEKTNKAPRTLTEFRDFRSNNPKVVTLGNGTMLRMMSELEWIDTAKRLKVHVDVQAKAVIAATSSHPQS